MISPLGISYEIGENLEEKPAAIIIALRTLYGSRDFMPSSVMRNSFVVSIRFLFSALFIAELTVPSEIPDCEAMSRWLNCALLFLLFNSVVRSLNSL